MILVDVLLFRDPDPGGRKVPDPQHWLPLSDCLEKELDFAFSIRRVEFYKQSYSVRLYIFKEEWGKN